MKNNTEEYHVTGTTFKQSGISISSDFEDKDAFTVNDERINISSNRGITLCIKDANKANDFLIFTPAKDSNRIYSMLRHETPIRINAYEISDEDRKNFYYSLFDDSAEVRFQVRPYLRGIYQVSQRGKIECYEKLNV